MIRTPSDFRIIKNVSLVIPVYNNSMTLTGQLNICEKILSQTQKEFEILICNDASSDASGRKLEHFAHRKHFRVISHTENQGIASTLMELYRKAKYGSVCLFSADGDWSADDIRTLMDTMRQTGADIVIGTRDKCVYSPYRRTISWLYRIMTIVLFGVDTLDAASIKIFRKKLYNEIPLMSKSIFFEAEFIIRAVRWGYRVTGVPVSFRRRKLGSDKGASLVNVATATLDMMRLFFTRAF